MFGRYKAYVTVAVILLWGVACWTFFQYAYAYHLFYQEQQQLFLLTPEYVSSYFGDSGCVSHLIGDFLTQFYYYRYAGATILTLCFVLVAVFLHMALRRFGLPRPVALIASLLVASVVAVGCFDETSRLWSVVSVLGWTVLLWIVSLSRRWPLRAALLLVGLWPAWMLFGQPQPLRLKKPNIDIEKILATDCEYYFGNYGRVLSLVEQDPKPLTSQLFYYNLIKAQRGQLADCMLKYYPNELGTFWKIGPDAPLLQIKSINELYWVLGDMTFTERAAMMSNVFSAENRSSRMIRRLAECSLVKGDSAAAQKYLGILSHTLAHRSWVENARRNPLYSDKARFQNRQDTIAITDNAHFIMMQLLDSNPDNSVALDYMLCSLLLLKDVQGFKRDYDRYCSEHPRTNRLYQEALCIFLAVTSAPPEEWQRYITSPDVLNRFAEYNRQRGSAKYKDTYWYYYDKIRPPKI